MSWLMVVPVLDAAVTDDFLGSCKLPVDQILIVDNGEIPAAPDWGGRYHRDRKGRNLGVSASWNLGARVVLDEMLDWLVIASVSLRFGEPGGLDLLPGLDRCDGECAVQTPFGWHLCALARSTIETVGLFDENFWPGYFEDTDYLYRMGLAGLPSPRENGRNWCQASVEGEYGEQARSLRYPFVAGELSFNRLGAYYAVKWGGAQGSEQHRTPFAGEHGIDYWPMKSRP